MAGDWIKYDVTLPEKPEVWRIAEKTGLDTDAVIGKLLRIWAWFDAHTEDGTCNDVSVTQLDGIARHPEFSTAMVDVGWMVIHRRGNRISIPKFDTHNGKSAKKRALTNARVKRFRNAGHDTDSVAKSLPEKNREDKTPKPPKGGFSLADAKKKNGARFDLSTDVKVAAAWRQELGRDPPAGKSLEECRTMFWQKVKEAQH
jgi:hypothetical protein